MSLDEPDHSKFPQDVHEKGIMKNWNWSRILLRVWPRAVLRNPKREKLIPESDEPLLVKKAWRSLGRPTLGDLYDGRDSINGVSLEDAEKFWAEEKRRNRLDNSDLKCLVDAHVGAMRDYTNRSKAMWKSMGVDL